MIMRKFLYMHLLVQALPVLLFAQPAYQPSRSEIMERYRKARVLDSLATRTIFKTSVQAHWQAAGKTFWYRNILKDSVQEYFYVDAEKGARVKVSREFVDSLAKDSARRRPFFERNWSRWASFNTDSTSPDKQFVAYVKDANVFIRPAGGGDPVQYTTDGDEKKPYGNLAWSPDSRYIVGYHIAPVKDSAVYYVLSSTDGTRGQLRQHPYKQPGDPFTTYEMYLFPIAGEKAEKVNTPLIDFFGAPQLHWRQKDSRYFTYEKVERGHQRFRIVEVDAQTAETRTVYDEQTPTFIYESRLYTH
jgi:hypothetical protein